MLGYTSLESINVWFPHLAARISWELVRKTSSQTYWIKFLGNMGQKYDFKQSQVIRVTAEILPQSMHFWYLFCSNPFGTSWEIPQIIVWSQSYDWLPHFYVIPALAAPFTGSNCWPCNAVTLIVYLGPHETIAGTLLEQPGEIKQVPLHRTWPGWTSSRDNGHGGRYVCWWC